MWPEEVRNRGVAKGGGEGEEEGRVGRRMVIGRYDHKENSWRQREANMCTLKSSSSNGPKEPIK